MVEASAPDFANRYTRYFLLLHWTSIRVPPDVGIICYIYNILRWQMSGCNEAPLTLPMCSGCERGDGIFIFPRQRGVLFVGRGNHHTGRQLQDLSGISLPAAENAGRRLC
jgi:hypothetical protein